ncbi:MAG: signal peptidase I [Ruminococcus sp.]|nr:signal peptidase I [Ruminococcus sp.]
MADNEELTAPDVGPPDGGEPNKAPPKKKKRTAKSYALAFFIKAGITALVLWIVFAFILGIFICHSNSAYPSIRDGELCLVLRHADLKQGTMIVYEHGGEIRFGRVIAFGGDSVAISDDYISVNGYGIFENVVYPTSAEGSAVSYPYNVPNDCVFVMNDYRSDLSDSRTFGGIPLDEVKGAVIFTMRTRGI